MNTRVVLIDGLHFAGHPKHSQAFYKFSIHEEFAGKFIPNVSNIFYWFSFYSSNPQTLIRNHAHVTFMTFFCQIYFCPGLCVSHTSLLHLVSFMFKDLLCFAANLLKDHYKSYLITQKGLRECLLILLTFFNFKFMFSSQNLIRIFDKRTKKEKITISGDFIRFSLSFRLTRFEGLRVNTEDTDSI